MLRIRLAILWRGGVNYVSTSVRSRSAQEVRGRHALESCHDVYLQGSRGSFGCGAMQLLFMSGLSCTISLRMLYRFVLRCSVILEEGSRHRLGLLGQVYASNEFRFLNSDGRTRSRMTFVYNLVASMVRTLSTRDPMLTAMLRSLVHREQFRHVLNGTNSR